MSGPSPAWRASATTVSGSSPEMILTATPLSQERAKRRGGLVAQLVRERDQAQRAHARAGGWRPRRRRRRRAARRRPGSVATSRTRRPRSVQLAVASPELRPRPPARRRDPVARYAVQERGGAEGDDPGRSAPARGLHPGPAGAGGPLGRNATRSTCGPTRTAPPRERRGAAGQRRAMASLVLLRAVALAASAAAAAITSSSVAPPSAGDRLDGQPVRGQRPGLVEAQDVHVAQALDRVRLLDQGAEAEDPDRARGRRPRRSRRTGRSGRGRPAAWRRPRRRPRTADCTRPRTTSRISR